MLKGNAAGDHFGWSVDGIGDVNGDGKADFIVGAPGTAVNGFANAGSAFVYSGAAANLLYRIDGTTLADPNGNFRDNLGYSVAGTGDVNGDGRPDFIIGSPWTDVGGPEWPDDGSAYVYSGATGTLLYQKNGSSFQIMDFGSSVAGAGDVNGDGRSDFIVGAPRSNPPGAFGAAGSAFVYSGATGNLIYQINGFSQQEQLGWLVAGAGDVNADGRDDFMIGTPLEYLPPDGEYVYGTTVLYSGLNGAPLFRKDGTGHSGSGTGDVSGDGKADFIFSGPSGTFVYGFPLPCPYAKGDMNGDGNLSPADVALLLGCVFSGTGYCDLCFADVNCDGWLSPSDVITLQNKVFLGTPFPC